MKGRTRIRNRSKKILFYVSAFLVCSFSLIPILWVVSTSLKPQTEIYEIPPRWLPRHTTLENFFKVLTSTFLLRYFLNTVIIAVGSTAVSLIVGVLSAYGFTRYAYPGSGIVLVSMLFSRVLPRVSLIIPFFIILRSIRLLNTYWGLWLIYLIIGMPIIVWLLKAFFDNLPKEVEDAAIMDGCTPLGILFRIVIPISRPVIGAVCMYSFILSWNEFLFALVLTLDSTTQPISIGLAFFKDDTWINWGHLMAASLLMSIPAVAVFTIFQRHLVRGLTEGAVIS